MAETTRTQFDAIVVGAGFAGLYMLHKLRGQGLSVRVIEAGSGVGGTWFWNRYPGARVDIESRDYGYSFDPQLEREWRWSERYAAQPELLRYLNHVADRFELRRDIEFETRVTAVHFHDSQGRWTVETDRGDSYSARFCVMATGCLSEPKDIAFPGMESFAGETYRTFDWPAAGVDFTGKRVAVIGTGSSAIQTITAIAPQCEHLTVFQRTPNYSVPANNRPLTAEEQAEWDASRDDYRARAKAQPLAFWNDPTEALALAAAPEERVREFERRWEFGGFRVGAPYADVGIDLAANRTVADWIAGKIRGIVADPKVAERLIPTTYPFGTKRLCVDTGYYRVYNRANVTLVDLRATPIEAITADAIRTRDAEYPCDAIVYAIGFDAMTGTLAKIDIRGRGGLTLRDKWAHGPVTYLGLMIAGFPNLFTVTGPGSPSVLTNMVMSIEQHVEWIAAAIAALDERGATTIEATEAAEAEWVAHVAEVAGTTLYIHADSWYMGANVPGKPRVFLPYVGGFDAYVAKCEQVAADGYAGFAFAAA
ncbi:MAG TPA: NAD(P)/FAD-dependent oxidoreductase [Novosphingobium sp.]|nr:NAD(P)/FAD-dependent oxidoreductase [Novosphingobium sp.]